MIVDTSAWVEFLVGSGSPAHVRLREAVQDGTTVLITPDLVLAEVLAGARNDREVKRLSSLLFTFEVEPLVAHDDAEHAASLYRVCRSKGCTIRSVVDCLIAAVAIRLDEPVLAADRDFVHLATHTPLRIVN